MASKKIEFRVGLIILLGLVIFFASLYWLQGYRLERNAQVIRVKFADVGALSVGDRVTVNGVKKGKVDNLRLTDDGVIVKVLLYGDVTLHSDARFVIRNMGLMGERFIAIWPGKDSTKLDESKIVQGQYDLGLPDVMGKLGEMVTELRNLMQSFRASVGSDSTMDELDQTVRNLRQISAIMSDYLEDNKARLDSTATNFYQAANHLNAMLSRNVGKVDSTVSRFDRASAELEEFVVRLDTLSVAAREFADKLNNPDGTLQLLLEDRRLYDDLRLTADNIDDLVQDIRAHPQKYINLKVEIF